MNKETENKLWQDPDWVCPSCQFYNLAIRSKCRNCDYIGGEIIIEEVLFLEVNL